MCHRFEGCRDLRDIPSAWLRPFDPLKKNALLRIAVLVGVKDIATLLEYPAGNPRHQSGSVRSVKQSNNRQSPHLGARNVPDQIGSRNHDWRASLTNHCKRRLQPLPLARHAGKDWSLRLRIRRLITIQGPESRCLILQLLNSCLKDLRRIRLGRDF